MKRFSLIPLLGALPLAASAQSFSENFDVDHSSSWAFYSSIAGDTAANNAGGEANFFFDYSTVGIPSAPGSGGTTRGLKMEANVLGTGVLSGMSASPLGQSFSGDYTLRFSAWENVLGPFPGGGSGSTQLTGGGIGATALGAQFSGSRIDGVGFVASGDGNATADYRAYTAVGAYVAESTGAYAAGTTAAATSESNAYYKSRYQGSVPTAQLALYPGQTGTPLPGALGMAWRQWEITRIGSTVTWKVDGSLIATVNKANLSGGNIFFGQWDINATSSTNPLSRNLSFGLIDNVSVAPVPEPASMLALGLGATAMLRRRKKA